MAIIDEWVNPKYLDPHVVESIRDSIAIKPIIKYAVLDDFFREEKLEQLIEQHKTLKFSEANDRITKDGTLLPYDGSVVFAQENHFGSELFYNEEWQEYCCYLTSAELQEPIGTEIKLRYHRPMADGFWIHTDSTIRSLVAICYFNKRWLSDDGGILQLWKVDDANPDTPVFEAPSGRLDFLNENDRIRTKTPGGGFPDGKEHDLILIDQIIPSYNKLFICNFQNNPAYHSVTPSNGRERLGFVQWLFDPKLRSI